MQKHVASWARIGATSTSRSRCMPALLIAQLVVAAVNDALRDVDAALVPGFPLIHRDHRWLTENLVAGWHREPSGRPLRRAAVSAPEGALPPNRRRRGFARAAGPRRGVAPRADGLPGAAGQASCDLRLPVSAAMARPGRQKARPHAGARGDRRRGMCGVGGAEQVRHATRIAFGEDASRRDTGRA